MQNINIVIGTGGTLLASGGDISLVASLLNITDNAAATNFPAIIYNNFNVAKGVQPSLIETPQIVNVTVTAANLTQYSLSISQQVNVVNGVPVDSFATTSARYNSGAFNPATQTNIVAGLIGSLANTNIQVSATGTTSLTLTATAGNPLFSVIDTGVGVLTVSQNLTATTAMPWISAAACQSVTMFPVILGVPTSKVVFTSSSVRVTTMTGTSTVTVTLTGNHNLVTGQTVTILGAWATGTLNGITGSATSQVTSRITSTGATTFTLDDVVGASSVAIGTAKIYLDAQAAAGQYTQLSASPLLVAGVLPTQTYSQVVFDYWTQDVPLNNTPQSVAGRVTLYTCETTSGVATTNYAGFLTRMNEVLNAYKASTVVSDPEAISKQ